MCSLIARATVFSLSQTWASGHCRVLLRVPLFVLGLGAFKMSDSMESLDHVRKQIAACLRGLKKGDLKISREAQVKTLAVYFGEGARIAEEMVDEDNELPAEED